MIPFRAMKGSDHISKRRPHEKPLRQGGVRTQNQALSALLFLYREVLGQELPWLDDVVHAKRAVRLPVVLTRDEVRGVIRSLRGTTRLMAILLYGAGLRLLEAAHLRVKDVDFARNQIIVRAGKGDKDRATPLPTVVAADLAAHLVFVRRQHERDLAHGAGWVELPWALARKVSQRRTRVGLAMGLSRHADLRRP